MPLIGEAEFCVSEWQIAAGSQRALFHKINLNNLLHTVGGCFSL